MRRAFRARLDSDRAEPPGPAPDEQFLLLVQLREQLSYRRSKEVELQEQVEQLASLQRRLLQRIDCFQSRDSRDSKGSRSSHSLTPKSKKPLSCR